MLTNIKSSQSRLWQFGRACLGGLIGIFVGGTMPLAQWLLNAMDRIQEKKRNNQSRWPVLIDIVAAVVVFYGSELRFGESCLWFLMSVESLLITYGFCRGITIGWQQALIDIPKKLWGWGNEEIVLPYHHSANTRQSSKILHRHWLLSIWEGSKGAFLGVLVGMTMPYAQLIQTMMSAKRKWPIIINSCYINGYAIYVGSTYLGKDLSLLILQRFEQALAAYGLIRGGIIGYQEESSKVLTFMWKGGFIQKKNRLIELPEERSANLRKHHRSKSYP